VKRFVALCALLVVAAHAAQAVASLRTVRRGEAVAPVAPAPQAESEPKVEMVFAELTSEADETTEDGSNDASAAEDMSNGEEEEVDAAEPLHVHYRRYTKPMDFLPNDHTTLVEVASREDGDEGGADKGSNPTYILPVDPFNYFPFFNGFSNVNPFSQFYPPPPYLYPQYTNYMHQYANHGAGHPPGYPSPGAYGGLGAAYGQGAHAGFPYNYPRAQPHMHYPFGAYKMDVSGPDVRTGSNNPPPFPQFMELATEGKLITPEIIPKSAEAVAEENENEDEEGDVVIASLIETATDVEAEDEEDVEFEAEGADEEGEDVEYLAENEGDAEEAEDVELLDESDEEGSLSDEHVEYESEGDSNEAEDLEYVL